MMQHKILLTILILFLFSEVLLPQSLINISRPRLSLVNNSLVIEYDILNSRPADLFRISLEISDSKGNIIKASAVTGDIGENIPGALNRKIIWDLKKDGIQMAEEIFVEVLAEIKGPPQNLAESQTARTTEGSGMKYISKGNIFISSLVFPGWGQSKVKEKKPVWLMGLTAYGCLTGSLILNRMGISTYDDYLVASDIDERNSLYNESLRQDNISEYLVYTAAGLWTINLIWALATPSSPNPGHSSYKPERIRFLGGYDPYLKSTVMTLSYRF